MSGKRETVGGEGEINNLISQKADKPRSGFLKGLGRLVWPGQGRRETPLRVSSEMGSRTDPNRRALHVSPPA